MNKTLITRIMKPCRVFSLPRKPKAMVLEQWSPAGWMEIDFYTIRLADGSIMDEVRSEEIEFI